MVTTDSDYMARALQLAKQGRGWVNPNPMVGCSIVCDGRIIGEGWHTRFGAPHAEREALDACAAAGEDPRGACAYVTLEPCAHTGKQPPCCDALIDAGIARVVIGSSDPNPLVSGRGIERMRAADIQVEEGILRAECDALNRPFFHYVRTGLPLMIAKYAMTIDGKTATRTGASRWITGPEARRHVHADRATYAAVMVGVGTVIADDPLLNARDAGESVHQPLRIIWDPQLRIPLSSKVVTTAQDQPTLIATCASDSARIQALEDHGCDVLVAKPADDRHRALRQTISILGERGVDSVLVEGGSTLHGALFDLQCIDVVQAYIAPKVFGGTDAPSPVGGAGVSVPGEAFVMANVSTTALGCDLLIEGDVER